MILRAEIAVVGAGPAGCSAALYLARRGKDVVLIDKAAFPRPKACGEGVMPAGTDVLRELGVWDAVAKAGRPYQGIRFIAMDGSQASGSFPGGRRGIAVRREVLDSILLEKAKTVANIRVLESRRAVDALQHHGAIVSLKLYPPAEVLAGFYLVADGASSETARRLGVRRLHPRRRRYGLRTHLAGVRGLTDRVEVFLLPDGEIYLAPQPEGRALVSLLFEEERLRSFGADKTAAFLLALRSCPALRDRLPSSGPITPIIGAGPLGGRAERLRGPNWLLLGDAAGSVDPITGEGISLALLNGKLAAEETLSGSRGKGYARKRASLTRRKRLLSSVLLAAAGRPALSSLAIRLLSWSPRTFDRLLSIC